MNVEKIKINKGDMNRFLPLTGQIEGAANIVSGRGANASVLKGRLLGDSSSSNSSSSSGSSGDRGIQLKRRGRTVLEGAKRD